MDPGRASLGDCRAEGFANCGRGITSQRGHGASEPAASGRHAQAVGGPHLPVQLWFVQVLAIRALGAENLRCGAFAVSVPFVCCLRSGLWFETLRLRFACERSGRTPKVSCSFNGKEALIVNCHLVSSGGGGKKKEVEALYA